MVKLCLSTNCCPADPDNGGAGDYIPIGDKEQQLLRLYDQPLPCFGCGIGWFSFLLGFVLPIMWYYGTILYFRNYDPRERTGLATCAIAVSILYMVWHCLSCLDGLLLAPMRFDVYDVHNEKYSVFETSFALLTACDVIHVLAC
ncbi:60S ribosomal protein L18a-like protein [Bienertia sinuspersici]